jgi:bifunctional DNA-binding transcriptional regulator/antitoxin component of YhaV-PrlF toxin-antitoxin module
MTEPKLRFKVTLFSQEGGGSGAAWRAPFDVQETFQTRARVPVRGTINGFPFRSSLMPMGACHRMVVNKALREGAGVKAGDTVEIVMERDEDARTIEPPPALKKELTKNKVAHANWKKLAFTHKKEMAQAMLGAKQEETRSRRLAKIMQTLKTGAKWTG